MVTCESTACTSRADVAVERVGGPTTRACWKHLMRMLLDGHHDVRGFRRLDWQPRCFQPDCDEPGVAVAHNEDDLPLPVCQHHFDDLGWVALPRSLMLDEPGWSHG